METVSDAQKYRFKMANPDKKAVCNVGFFSWTRHPNYFGEIIIQFCELGPVIQYESILTDQPYI